jgi:hypothetical protein
MEELLIECGGTLDFSFSNYRATSGRVLAGGTMHHDDDCLCPICHVIEVIRDVAIDVYKVATAGLSDEDEARPYDPSWAGSKLKDACTEVAIRAVYAARNSMHFEPTVN